MQYYFPIITSTVEDVHFNCFYPGKGPGSAGTVIAPADSSVKANPSTKLSPACQSDGTDCCEVITDVNKKTCCNGARYSNVSACKTNLESNSILTP